MESKEEKKDRLSAINMKKQQRSIAELAERFGINPLLVSVEEMLVEAVVNELVHLVPEGQMKNAERTLIID